MSRSSMSRRFQCSWRTCLSLAAAAIILLVAANGQADENKPSSNQPNIVLIMADDMGFSDLGCYGSEIQTPTLDKLAAGGLRLTQFYNTGRCCPTRAALLTGLYPHQAGIGHMERFRQAPGYLGHLNRQCVTLGEALSAAGYHTLMTGKWHVGQEYGMWPVDRGFERYYGLLGGAANYFKPDGTYGPMALDHKKIHPGGGDFYITDAFTDHAVKFVEESVAKKDGKPFFLYLAYTAPHWPLHARPEDIARYRGKYKAGWDALREARHKRQIELGLVDSGWPLTPRGADAPAWNTLPPKRQEGMDLRMAVYAAQIDRLDQQIGRVVATLTQLNQLDNTLILFLADNGGCAEGGPFGFGDIRKPDTPAGSAGTHASYGEGWANASNTPFRRYKHWVHEGGISTPLIAHWPAGIKPRGAIVPQVGHLIDIMPTLLDVAGGEYPKTYDGRDILPAAGRSLASVLKTGQPIEREPIYWEHEGNRAVRQGNWKLVAQHTGPWELYDISQDRTEMHNVAADHPERVKQLSSLYDAWAKKCHVLLWPVNPPPKKAKPMGKSKPRENARK